MTWLRTVFALVLLPTASACESCRDAPAVPDAQAALTPVAAPPNLYAELVVATPDATWSKAQRSVGGLIALLSPNAGGLLASLAGADAGLGSEVEGGSAFFGVLAKDDWVIAARVRNAQRARELVVQSRFTPASDDGTLATFEGSGVAIGVAPAGWLLVGNAHEAIEKLGPYAYRTLPTRPLPRSNVHVDLTRALFEDLIKGSLEKKWKDLRGFLLQKDAELRAAHGGRQADFGDALGIVEAVELYVRPRIDALGDLGPAMLDFDVREEHLTGALAIESGVGPSKTFVENLRPGLSEIGPFPLDTLAVGVVRDDEAGRRGAMQGLSDGLKRSLGKRLGEKEGKELEAALQGWADARGDWLSVAVGNRGVVLRSPAKAGADRAVRDIVVLAQRPVLKGPLDSSFGLRDLKLGPGNFGSAGKGTIAELTRASPFSKLSVGWVVHEDLLDVAVGSTVESLIAASADDSFATEVKRLGPDTVIALVGHSSFTEPLSSVALLRRDGKLSLTLDLTTGLFRQAVDLFSRSP